MKQFLVAQVVLHLVNQKIILVQVLRQVLNYIAKVPVVRVLLLALLNYVGLWQILHFKWKTQLPKAQAVVQAVAQVLHQAVVLQNYIVKVVVHQVHLVVVLLNYLALVVVLPNYLALVVLHQVALALHRLSV